MAYWSDKVAGALQDSLPRLKDFAARRDLDASSYRRALQEYGRLSAAEVRARVAEIPNPGALPSPEHDRSGDWFLRFPARFRNHREAREWAHDRVRGITTVAVDGSELRPSRDWSLPIGFVQVAWFRNPHLGHEAERYEKDAALEVVLPEQSGPDVGLRRFEAECQTVIEQMRQVAGLVPPPLVYFDGTLIVSFTSEMTHDLAQRYIDAIVAVIQASEELRVPLVGYVDASDAKDLCVLLAHLADLPTPRGVNDTRVLGAEMGWGDRTKAFVCARDDTVLSRYAALGVERSFRRELAFVYLQTTAGGPPARLDVPLWVVREGLLDHVVDVTRAEVVATAAGYPYAIESADAAAVLRGDDRERLLRAAQRFCEHFGMDLSLVPKAASKRRRRV
jgi:hypothetical protein